MTERERKIAFIARLSERELKGWIWAREVDKRELFDGEQAALTARAKELNITI